MAENKKEQEKEKMKELKIAQKLMKEKLPHFNNDRRVVVLTEDTKRGEEIIKKASRYCAYSLNQIYDRPSATKQQIYDDCYDMYRNDKESESFGICSFNPRQFTVSWIYRYGIRCLTRDYDYIVVTNDVTQNILADFT